MSDVVTTPEVALAFERWKTAAAVLRGTRELLTPITWIKGRMFGRHVGDVVREASAQEADSWCATGGIAAIVEKLKADEAARDLAHKLLAHAIGGPIESWNDDQERTLPELHTKLDAAIVLADAGPKLATVGDKAHADVDGIGGIATGGYASTLTGGYESTLTGGNRSTLTGGDESTLTGGYESTLTGGNRSTLTGGYASTLTGGNRSTLTGGDASTLTGGYASTLTGGDASTLCVRWWDGKRYRIAAFDVGENGIEAGVAYRCEAGKLIKA